MSILVNAIHKLLENVPDNEHFPWQGEWRDMFDALDRAVWIDACRCGLDAMLPQKTGSSDNKYLGKTNLPIMGTFRNFTPCGLRRWRNDLVALSALAKLNLIKSKKERNKPRTRKSKNPSDCPRLSFDSQTQTVNLDGKQFRIENPKSYFLYQTIAEANGQPMTRNELRKQSKGLKGDKTIPNLLKKLPAKIRKTIKSGSHGYWLCLAPK
jgi:hypothetical protein